MAMGKEDMNQGPPVAPRNHSRTLHASQYVSDDANQQRSWSRAISMQSQEEYAKVVKPHLRATNSSKGRITSYDQYMGQNTGNRPRSKTNYNETPDCDEDLYLSASEIASVPTGPNFLALSSNYRSTAPTNMAPTNPPPPPEPQQHGDNRYSALHQKIQPHATAEAAIYGIAQGKGENLVMEYQQVRKMNKRFFKKLMKSDVDSPDIAELKLHLRLPQNASVPDMIENIHQSMKLSTSAKKEQKEEDDKLYLIDFQDCKDKQKLREQILQLFTTPGPPSVAYQRVNAKMDNLINCFAEIVVRMRLLKNTTILSPVHAQNVLGQESEPLIRLLQANEMWIRWGTDTGLPPITHMYMLKQPPSYEMRKAVTISLISKKKDVLRLLLNSRTRQEVLMPPIYSRLESEDQKTRWQVSEFDPESRQFQSRECVLPTWLEECGKLVSHFYSGNRTTFGLGDHIYALYSVYLIIIKDVTLTEDKFEKDSRIPCAHQIYVGCSSTGVLYRFLNIENSHCENIKRILEDAPTLSSYRCYQQCELVEACLALSWIRRQPRAVFVINSFQEGNMNNLSLCKKKPFHDKMVDLKEHYITSKKLNPLYDMRFGMNCLADTNHP